MTIPIIDEAVDIIPAEVTSPPACEFWEGDPRKALTASPEDRCGAPASWIQVVSCGHDDFLCTPHAERIREYVGNARAVHCFDPRPPMHAPFQPVTLDWRPL